MENENHLWTKFFKEKCHLLLALKILYLPLGILIDKENNTHERILTVTIVVLFGFSFCGIILILLKVTNLAEIMDVLYTMNGNGYVFVMIGVGQIVKKDLLNLYRRIETENNINPAFEDTSNRICSELVRGYGSWILLPYSAVMLIPLIIHFSTDTPLGELKLLIYPAWHPWTVDTLWKYYVTFLLQLVTVTMGYFVVFGGSLIIGCYAITMKTYLVFIEEQLRRIDHLMKERPMSEAEKALDENYETKLKREFIVLVHKQQTLISFTNEILAVGSYFSIFAVEMFGMFVILLITALLKASDDKLYCAKFPFLFFILSCIGEMVAVMNDKIKNVVYDISWYSQDVRAKKGILLVLTQCQMEYKLTAFVMYLIKLSFFMSAMKLCYSSVQFLSQEI